MSRPCVAMVFVVALAFNSRRAPAEEVATVYNESTYLVQFHLRWASAPADSARIDLPPGRTYKTVSSDGDALYIRFDSSPGTPPPREVRLKMYTARTFPQERGWVSSFRNSGGPFVYLDANVPR